MATFMQKEGLIELMEMAKARIARVSTVEEFRGNQDVKKIKDLIKEVVDIKYTELDFDYYKEILEGIEQPYIQIEDAKIEIRKRMEKHSKKGKE